VLLHIEFKIKLKLIGCIQNRILPILYLWRKTVCDKRSMSEFTLRIKEQAKSARVTYYSGDIQVCILSHEAPGEDLWMAVKWRNL